MLNELEAVSPGLSPKGVTEQSNYYVFSEGRVFTFNDEIACSHKSSLGKKMTGAVLASPLVSLLGKMEEDEIGLDPAGDVLRVKGKNKTATITMQADVKLDVSEIGKPETDYRDLPEEFLEGLKMVAECASDDQSDFRYTCVHFTPKAIEATDNWQVGRFVIPTGFSESVLIRKTAVRHIVNLEVTQIAEGRAWMHFKAGKDLTMACRVARNEEYPKLKQVFDVTGAKAQLPKGLKDAVERASVFFDDDKSEYVRVQIENGRLRMRTTQTARSVGCYRESRKITYDGPPMEFVISARLLADISEKYVECTIGEGRLVVDGGRFKFLTLLKPPEEKEADDV